MQPDLSDDAGALTVTDVQPHVLKAKASRNDADSPVYNQAINGPHAEKWWQAIVLPMTWAFHLKRFPSGLVKKFKATFCVCSDMQVEGVDVFETWAPVVQWTIVRTMLILATKLDLVSAQADINAAFVHTNLGHDEHIDVHQAAGFQHDGNYVYKLNCSVYGLKQSPRNFFHYLSEHLVAQGLVPSELDPCLFIGKSVIAVVHVDDVLISSKSADKIDGLIHKLHSTGISIHHEGTAQDFLGVDIMRTTTLAGHQITLCQPGLAKRVVEAVGLCSRDQSSSQGCRGSPSFCAFNYAAVVGILLYLSGHSRPNNAFAVHQCARYTFWLTCCHELALIRTGHYLKGTMDQGLIMKPSSTPQVDC
ncbi:hypothetical protein ACHAW6_010599 [Cyclotella cf. meneghiniana]